LLPVLIPDTRAHVGIIVALAGIVCLAIFARTPLGYRVRLFGANNYLGARAGVAETRLVLALLLLGGAVAGLAGWMQVAGVDQRLYPTVAASVGFNGLFVALLGGGRPLGILIASLLFAALLKGGDSLQVASNVSPELINVIVGMIVLGFVARRALAGRVSG
jgi:simple sugar transport system permease protein